MFVLKINLFSLIRFRGGEMFIEVVLKIEMEY